MDQFTLQLSWAPGQVLEDMFDVLQDKLNERQEHRPAVNHGETYLSSFHPAGVQSGCGPLYTYSIVGTSTVTSKTFGVLFVLHLFPIFSLVC